MEEFDITPILSDPTKMAEINQEAKERTDQQLEDSKQNKNASYAYGKRNNNNRPYEVMLKDHRIGCLAEFSGSVLTLTTWDKQRRQYAGNKKSDLFPIYKGKKTRMEVRGSRWTNAIIFRCNSEGEGNDFWTDSNTLLFGATDLPNGLSSKNKLISKMGYLDFGTLQKLCRENPEWYKPDFEKGNPYYCVPLDVFSNDFTAFTPTEEYLLLNSSLVKW